MIDIRKIERELGITLPQHYVTFMQQLGDNRPGPENLSDLSSIFADADIFIKINQDALAPGMLRQLPDAALRHKLVIGYTGGTFFLINSQNATDERLYYFDRDEEDSKVQFYDSLTSFKEEMDALNEAGQDYFKQLSNAKPDTGEPE